MVNPRSALTLPGIGYIIETENFTIWKVIPLTLIPENHKLAAHTNNE